MSVQFSKPHDVSCVDMAFGGDVRKLMPKYEDCKEYYRSSCKGERLFSEWFYCGIKSTSGLVAREGIDKGKALAHIKSIMVSWEPKHEHKTAACAYLFEKWFDLDKSTWGKAKAA